MKEPLGFSGRGGRGATPEATSDLSSLAKAEAT